MPLSRQTGIVDPDDATSAASRSSPMNSSRRRSARLGRPESSAWKSTGPTAVGRRACRRRMVGLGFCRQPRDRQRILDEAAAAGNAPRAILVVCSLAATPDRGTRAFIDALRRSSRSPVILLLTEGQRLRSAPGRTGRAAHRGLAAAGGWRRYRRRSGARARPGSSHRHQPRSAARLLGYGGRGHRARRIDRAFALILEHAAEWSGAPGMAQQAELQRAIAGSTAAAGRPGRTCCGRVSAA